MAVYTNKSGGMLILPNGTEIAADGSAEISAEAVKNVGVGQWIADGWLDRKSKATKAEADAQEKADADAKAKAEAERADLQKQAADLQIEVTDEMTSDDIKTLVDAELAK